MRRAGLRADAVEAVIHARGSDHGEVEHYDHLIRATGLDTDVARTTHPLMTHLREAGMVAADALGLGIAVGARYAVLDAHGRAVPGLHCLGPLLRARLWEITAVAELREAARELAGYLLDDGARVASRRLVAVDAVVGADERVAGNHSAGAAMAAMAGAYRGHGRSHKSWALSSQEQSPSTPFFEGEEQHPRCIDVLAR